MEASGQAPGGVLRQSDDVATVSASRPTGENSPRSDSVYGTDYVPSYARGIVPEPKRTKEAEVPSLDELLSSTETVRRPDTGGDALKTPSGDLLFGDDFQPQRAPFGYGMIEAGVTESDVPSPSDRVTDASGASRLPPDSQPKAAAIARVNPFALPAQDTIDPKTDGQADLSDPVTPAVTKDATAAAALELPPPTAPASKTVPPLSTGAIDLETEEIVPMEAVVDTDLPQDFYDEAELVFDENPLSDEAACDAPSLPFVGPAPTAVPSLMRNAQGRPALVFQPAVPMRDHSGRQILRPRVHVAEEGFHPIAPSEPVIQTPAVPLGESRIQLNGIQPPAPEDTSRWYEDLGLGDAWSRLRNRRRRPVVNSLRHLAGNHRLPAYDLGVGSERLPFALFEMDASQPQNHFRLRFEAGYDWENPDRAEFLWSKLGGRGPQETTPPESSVDYQDVRLITEVGGEKFSLTTELPLRFVDPTVLGNTGGFGDMVLTTKTVLFTGKQFQLTQVLRNQLATGASASGRGTGHASMEPGFLFRYRRSNESIYHSELKLNYPIAGDPDHSSPILRYGFGMARLLYDSDTMAIIPTFEMVGWSVLSGRETVPSDLLGIAQVNELDGLNIFNLYPGLRIVKDAGGDMGVFELGISGGFTVTDNHWYESMVRMDIAFGF